MLLQWALGQALTHSRGAPTEARVALNRALLLAENMADAEYQFRVLFGLWLFLLRSAELRECIALCRKYEELAVVTGDNAERVVADNIYGQTLYYLGEHEAAVGRLEQVRAAFAMHPRGGYRIRIGADIVVATLCYQAVALWSLGWADGALRIGRDAVEEARRIGHPVSLSIALTAPRSTLLLKMGYLDEAEREIATLIEHTRAHSLPVHHSYGLCSKGCLAAAKGDLAEAESLLRFGLQRSREAGNSLFHAFFQGELAAVLGAAGRTDDGRAEIDAALIRAEESGSLWCMPELLRIKGELTCAEEWFVQSLDLARRQKALSWELRSAISLARLWQQRGERADSVALVRGAYVKFVEGFDTTDLRAAREFLQDRPLTPRDRDSITV
jgi:predicted ATPase